MQKKKKENVSTVAVQPSIFGTSARLIDLTSRTNYHSCVAVEINIYEALRQANRLGGSSKILAEYIKGMVQVAVRFTVIYDPDKKYDEVMIEKTWGDDLMINRESGSTDA